MATSRARAFLLVRREKSAIRAGRGEFFFSPRSRHSRRIERTYTALIDALKKFLMRMQAALLLAFVMHRALRARIDARESRSACRCVRRRRMNRGGNFFRKHVDT
jgi:hypothetical protein